MVSFTEQIPSHLFIATIEETELLQKKHLPASIVFKTMHRLNILAIHRDTKILATVLRLINTNEQWNGIGAASDEEAINMFHQQPIGIVLFCAGIDPKSEEKLKAVFSKQNPAPIFLQHYGGGSGLLSAGIYEALAKQGH